MGHAVDLTLKQLELQLEPFDFEPGKCKWPDILVATSEQTMYALRSCKAEESTARRGLVTMKILQLEHVDCIIVLHTEPADLDLLKAVRERFTGLCGGA